MISYAPFERALAQPFHYGDRILSTRCGILLQKNGIYSEATPLPGHSSDNLPEVLHILSTRPCGEILDAVESEQSGIPPSLRFALEGLKIQEKPGSHTVRSNALLPWTHLDDAKAKLGQFRRDEYKVCKLKINPRNWKEQLPLIEENPDFLFRLDANCSFSAGDLGALVKELETKKLLSQVEYLEEPFDEIWTLESFKNCPISFAADESAANPFVALSLLEEKNPPSVFIVKPTVSGGLFSLQKFLNDIRASGRKFVVTSALEGEAGRRNIIAFLSHESSEVAGLSTGCLFQESFLNDSSVWSGVPPISAMERGFMASLTWRNCS
jgi:O-succinylbenzoate synthase